MVLVLKLLIITLGFTKKNTSKNTNTTINNKCENIESDKGLKNYCEYYIKRKDKDGNTKTITKAFMIKFSGDKENISGDKENNSNKAVNKKYATIVVPTE